MSDRGALDRFLAELVRSGSVTAAAALVGNSRRVFARAETPGVAGRLFDLASLTKPVTATLALRLDERGKLPLATPIGDIWPRAASALAPRRLEDLLRHRSGLQAWAPLYSLRERPEDIESLLLDGSLLGARRGTYSDLGYVLWALAARRVLGESSANLLAQHILPAMGPDEARTTAGSEQALGCEIDTRREVRLASELGLKLARQPAPEPGIVQDGNARFLGGYCGHTGVFATPEAVWRLAREWLAPGNLISPSSVRGALIGRGRYVLGWERRRASRGPGAVLGPGAFGHAGFTGGSCWVDPARDRVLVLLAHRTRRLPDLDPWRRRFHRLEFPA